MKYIKNNYTTIILAVVLVILVVGLFAGNDNRLGGAPDGTASVVATSTFQSVTAGSAELLFATSTNCSSRIISTQGSEIRLTFSDRTGQRPTGVNGYPQTSSTTVAYDAELYGCNAVWVYPFGTDTITVTETR